MNRLLAELGESKVAVRSDYILPGSQETASPNRDVSEEYPLGEVIAEAGESKTGLVVFWTEEQVEVVVPPLPLRVEIHAPGAHTAPLLELLDTEYGFGIVLLRLGRYAVGVLRGDKLVASKSDTRYVKSRHRKGGSSAGRFARSRERLIRELYDKCCEVARSVFQPHQDSIDYVLLGGERHTLNAFRKRCRYVQDFGDKVLDRVLEVDRPGRRALETIGGEVWKSRVITLERERTN